VELHALVFESLATQTSLSPQGKRTARTDEDYTSPFLCSWGLKGAGNVRKQVWQVFIRSIKLLCCLPQRSLWYWWYIPNHTLNNLRRIWIISSGRRHYQILDKCIDIIKVKWPFSARQNQKSKGWKTLLRCLTQVVRLLCLQACGCYQDYTGNYIQCLAMIRSSLCCGLFMIWRWLWLWAWLTTISNHNYGFCHSHLPCANPCGWWRGWSSDSQSTIVLGLRS